MKTFVALALVALVGVQSAAGESFWRDRWGMGRARDAGGRGTQRGRHTERAAAAAAAAAAADPSLPKKGGAGHRSLARESHRRGTKLAPPLSLPPETNPPPPHNDINHPPSNTTDNKNAKPTKNKTQKQTRNKIK